MTPEQKAAYVTAMAACAMADIAAMQAANQACAMAGLSPSFTEADFTEIPNRHGIHHNAVLTLFHT